MVNTKKLCLLRGKLKLFRKFICYFLLYSKVNQLHTYMKWSEVKWKSLNHVQLFATPWTTIHRILQARILQWVAFPFSRRSSQSRDRTQVSLIAGGFFTNWAPREAPQWFLIVVLLFGLYKKDLFPLLKLIDNSTAKSVEHKINSKLQNK